MAAYVSRQATQEETKPLGVVMTDRADGSTQEVLISLGGERCGRIARLNAVSEFNIMDRLRKGEEVSTPGFLYRKA